MMTYIRMDPACFHSLEDLCIRLDVVYSHSEFLKGVFDRIACGIENHSRSVPRLIVALDDILPTR